MKLTTEVVQQVKKGDRRLHFASLMRLKYLKHTELLYRNIKAKTYLK